MRTFLVMIRYGICYQITLPETGAFAKTLLPFPENPCFIKGGHRPIQIVATAIMTPQLAREMLTPSGDAVSLANVAHAGHNPMVQMHRIRVMGHDFTHAVMGIRNKDRFFLSYTLFGVDEDTGGLAQFRIFPAQADLPHNVYEILPPPQGAVNIPSFYANRADLYLDKCVGCAAAPPLGADCLCARCLLLKEL